MEKKKKGSKIEVWKSIHSKSKIIETSENRKITESKIENRLRKNNEWINRAWSDSRKILHLIRREFETLSSKLEIRN